MGLQWRDVVGAGVVVLRVVPGKALIELGDGLAVLPEATRRCRRAAYGAGRGCHEGRVLWHSGAREELGRVVGGTEFLNRLGRHPAPPPLIG